MNRNKLFKFSIVTIVLTIQINDSHADVTRMTMTTDNSGENFPILNKISGCMKNCKEGDIPCATQCLKHEIDVNDKSKLKNFLLEYTTVVQKMFCLIGCEVTGLCEEIKKTGKLFHMYSQIQFSPIVVHFFSNELFWLKIIVIVHNIPSTMFTFVLSYFTVSLF